MTQVVRYFKPGKNGEKTFYKEVIYHRFSAFKFATEHWARAYGEGFFELASIERVA